MHDIRHSDIVEMTHYRTHYRAEIPGALKHTLVLASQTIDRC